MKRIFIYSALLAGVALWNSCSPAKGDYPGHEYMPDMGHSVAYEANVYDYYWYNRWGTEAELHQLVQPRFPVDSSIARGYVGLAAHSNDYEAMMMAYKTLRGGNASNAMAVPLNGHVPYYYKDTEEERVRANREIIANPFPITNKGLERGKELYEIYCGICHGNTGNGAGYLVAEDNPNAKYPAQPAILLQDTFYNSSNGRLYHAIMYGKNVMGGYSDKLSFEERWQVIHYIRALQAKEKGKEYSETANTLNANFGVPMAQLKREWEARKAAQTVPAPANTPAPANDPAHGQGGDHHGDAHHGNSKK